MTGTVLVGTSGYSYKDWVGPVYPAGTPSKNFLKIYGEEFVFSEINFSYYRQPDPRTMERMAYVVGDRFRFSVKVHRSLTHDITDDFRRDAAQFREGIAPLIEAAKLGAVLIQFPYSFHYNPKSRQHLQALCDEFAGLPAAVEFRNSEWQRDSVYEGLRGRGTAIVDVDEPHLPGLPRPAGVVTSHIAYVRFHGRNKINWWKGDNASRYDYLYGDDELSEWLPRIRRLAEQAPTVMVAFNNHWKGQAVVNARRLKQMIEND